MAEPYTPRDDAQVLEKLPGRAGDTNTRELNALRDSALRSPADASAQAALAQRYVDMAGARGDPRYIGYADAVISRFQGPLTPDLLSLRGVTRQYRHDFSGGLNDFAAALALDADYAQAHAWRGAIFLVQANYSAARLECNALNKLGRPSLQGACLGLTLAYNGNLAEAYRILKSTLNGVTSPESQLWLLTRMGEVAAWQGNSELAKRHYTQALTLGRDDVYLLAAWSDFLLDSGKADDVIKLLANWESADSLLLRLAIAESITNHPSASKHHDMMRDRFEAARARGDTTHRAEEARFELQLRHDPATSLRLAQSNFSVLREPRDARVLLEAAVASHDTKGAQAAVDWLATSGFQDTRLHQLVKELP
jgi:tetratricopeptide (TPR) repeat protein